jgi:hypothetical protein
MEDMYYEIARYLLDKSEPDEAMHILHQRVLAHIASEETEGAELWARIEQAVKELSGRTLRTQQGVASVR